MTRFERTNLSRTATSRTSWPDAVATDDRATAASPKTGAAVARCSSNSVRKGGVDNVNGFGLGLGRISAGLARIAYVFKSSQCFQGPECGSSPTSGTAFPLVRGVFALTCVQSLTSVSDARGAGLAWPPRWPIQVCGWRVHGPGWWALRLLWGGVMRFLVPVLSGWSWMANTGSWFGIAGTT